MGQQLFASLSSIIDEIGSKSPAEVSGVGAARLGTTTRQQARAGLREDLEAINRTARAMADEVPGLDDKFRAPRSNDDQQLLAAARAAAVDAPPFSAQFIAHEMPADFLAHLSADIAAMEATMSEQSGGIGRGDCETSEASPELSTTW